MGKHERKDGSLQYSVLFLFSIIKIKVRKYIYMLSEIVPIFFPSPKISSTHKKTHIHTHKTQNSYFLHRKIQYSFFPLFPDLESPPPQACGTGGQKGCQNFDPPKALRIGNFLNFPFKSPSPTVQLNIFYFTKKNHKNV